MNNLADFARQLERELNEVRKVKDVLAKDLCEVSAENIKLRKDKARLDWLLDCNDGDILLEMVTRHGIDAAMEKAL